MIYQDLSQTNFGRYQNIMQIIYIRYVLRKSLRLIHIIRNYRLDYDVSK